MSTPLLASFIREQSGTIDHGAVCAAMQGRSGKQGVNSRFGLKNLFRERAESRFLMKHFKKWLRRNSDCPELTFFVCTVKQVDGSIRATGANLGRRKIRRLP
jgi:hypothetical protein